MKLSEQIKRCLDGSGCGNCEHHEADTKFICRKLLQKAYERIKGYEELEEKGLLLKLPCKVGDRIYRIDTDEKIENREIEIYDIDNIVICSDGEILLKYDAYDGVICYLENITTDKPYLDYYRCFLTKEEADKALQKMNEMEGKE